jgi:hypothetical protein
MIYNRGIRGEQSARKMEAKLWMLRKPENSPTLASRW